MLKIVVKIAVGHLMNIGVCRSSIRSNPLCWNSIYTVINMNSLWTASGVMYVYFHMECHLQAQRGVPMNQQVSEVWGAASLWVPEGCRGGLKLDCGDKICNRRCLKTPRRSSDSEVCRRSRNCDPESFKFRFSCKGSCDAPLLQCAICKEVL